MARKKKRRPTQRVAAAGNGSGSSGSARRSARPGREDARKPARKPAKPIAEAPRYTTLLSGPSVYPPLAPSLLRSLKAIASSVPILLVTLLLVPVLWAGLLAVGLRTFPPSMVDALAIPPASSFFDLAQSASLFGLQGTAVLAFIALITLVRAVIIAVLTGLLDEALDFGSASKVGLIRGLRAFGPSLAFTAVATAGALLGNIAFSLILGQTLGQAGLFITMIGVLFFFGFVPAIGVRQGLPPREALGRSARAARLDGWPRHMLMCALYFLLVTVGLNLVLAAIPGANLVTANPGLAMLIYVLAASVLHVVFLGAFVDRYKTIEDFVPTGPKKRTPPEKGRSRR